MKTEGYKYFNTDLLSNFKIDVDSSTLETIRVISYLINHKSMEKAEGLLGIDKNGEIIKFIQLFKKCWSSYTHILFNKLCKSVYFKKIFRLFYQSFRSQISPKSSGQGVKKSSNRGKGWWKSEGESLEKDDVLISNLKKFKPVNSNLEKYEKKIEALSEMFKACN